MMDIIKHTEMCFLSSTTPVKLDELHVTKGIVVFHFEGQRDYFIHFKLSQFPESIRNERKCMW